MQLFVNCAIEGDMDEIVIKKILQSVGASPGAIYGKCGKSRIHKSIQGYNQAAYHSPWLVVVDLDRDYDCAPLLRSAWLPNPSPYLCFRVAVREIESWLLADAEHLAKFLAIPLSSIPPNPDCLLNPKEHLIELAKKSKHKSRKEDFVPRPHSGRTVGPGYYSQIVEFVTKPPYSWRPHRAAKQSPSLNKCLASLIQVLNNYKNR